MNNASVRFKIRLSIKHVLINNWLYILRNYFLLLTDVLHIMNVSKLTQLSQTFPKEFQQLCCVYNQQCEEVFHEAHLLHIVSTSSPLHYVSSCMSSSLLAICLFALPSS